MSSMRAIQLVKKLLEYGLNPDAPTPGSPDDPMRQTTGPFNFQPNDFVGTRPGQAYEIPDEDLLEPEDLMDKPPQQQPVKRLPASNKLHPRFKWRPPPPTGP